MRAAVGIRSARRGWIPAFLLAVAFTATATSIATVAAARPDTIAPGQIDTFAGGQACTADTTATRTCLTPYGVAIGPDHAVYVSDATGSVSRLNGDGTLTVVAGNGPIGPTCGDDGPAIGACLVQPTGIAFDSAGDLYIADGGGERVRKVDTAGTITTVAGRHRGLCGDGGPATAACLDDPTAVAVAADGTVYIADTGNNRVRVVDPAGIIATYAGSVTTKFCGDGGPAVHACLKAPRGVAVASDGSVLIADTEHNRIRRVAADGTISTIAGTGSPAHCGDGKPALQACVSGPDGVSVDGDGNVFIAQSGDNRVRKIDTAGVITTVAGNLTIAFCGDGDPATSACLNGPTSVAAASNGALYIADARNDRVRKVSPTGTISTVAGNGTVASCGDGGPAVNACIADPHGVAIGPRHRVYITESESERIRRVDANGTITTIAGSGVRGFCGDGGPALTACFQMGTSAPPYDHGAVAVAPDGSIYVADTFNNRVRVITPDGMINTIAGNGDGDTCGNDGPAIDACVPSPVGVALDTHGNLYVTTEFEVRKITPDGTISDFAGSGVLGDRYCGDHGPAIDACFDELVGIAVDGRGNVYVADSDNNRIRKINPHGIVTTVAGGFHSTCPPHDGGRAVRWCVEYPHGVAVRDGEVYFTDSGRELVSRIDGAGRIHTVAGNSTSGTSGFCGDGGPATDACFSQLDGVAVDAQGTVYVSDSLNRRVRAVGAP